MTRNQADEYTRNCNVWVLINKEGMRIIKLKVGQKKLPFGVIRLPKIEELPKDITNSQRRAWEKLQKELKKIP